MANPFVHIELQTNDLPKAKEFYATLFDWQLEDLAMQAGGDYTIIKVGEGTGGGMMTCPIPGVPPHWLAYVEVDNIVASTEKAKSLGATIAQDTMDIGEHGWISIIIDPAGAVLGLWQGKTA